VTAILPSSRDRWQNAVTVVLGLVEMMALCRHAICRFSEWCSYPFSAALSRLLPSGDHGGVFHLDGHSVVKSKKEAST